MILLIRQWFKYFVIGIIFNFFNSFFGKEPYTISLLNFCENFYKKEIELHEQDNDSIKIISDLSEISGSLYNNLTEITALYCSGMFYDFHQIKERILLEFGKYFMKVGKILIGYGPKMLQNPRLSLQTKIKQSVYIFGFISIFVLWIREMSHNKKNVVRPRHDIYRQSLYLNDTMYNENMYYDQVGPLSNHLALKNYEYKNNNGK